MLITSEMLKEIMGYIEFATIIVSAIIFVYKAFESNKRQSEELAKIKKEQEVMVAALVGCLEGMVEFGLNGPCKEALKNLKQHLIEQAHRNDI